ncbi:hypothetical protein TUBRATIS_20790 [Tubulinosema ratisbonensis]|uniref:Uncharacterized protein n=1 Tax=Tubulinosema ratisbonensis TaxID=291195 RepID=A0A437AJV0_9MICR|nr:hypothetical protein TUBRATIS_20790 [Tubulinosema ratisbonensis]
MVSKTHTITEIITLYRKIKKHFPDSIVKDYKMAYDFQKLKDIKQTKYFLFDGINFYQENNLQNLPLVKEKTINLENKEEKEYVLQDYSDIFHITEDDTEHIEGNDSASNEINKEETYLRNINLQTKRRTKEDKSFKQKYWINIFQPTKEDLDFLYSQYSIHPTSLVDILESNTDEKIDLYSDYTFISLKLLTSKDEEDIDLNIIIFNNCIITTHNNHWSGMNDIINFLILLTQYTKFKTHWVVFSILVEVLQDIKFKTDLIEEIILEEKKKNSSCIPTNNARKAFLMKELNKNNESLLNLDFFSDEFELNYEVYKQKTDTNLKCNFNLTNKVSNLLSYIKSKKQILKEIIKNSIQKKNSNKFKTLNNLINYYFGLLIDDFMVAEEILRDLQKKLERQQDLLLALLDMRQSLEANLMSKAINRFALITFIFLPCQTIAGLWGMNVRVPFEKSGSLPFYFLTFSGFLFSFFLFYLICKRTGKKMKKIF